MKNKWFFKNTDAISPASYVLFASWILGGFKIKVLYKSYIVVRRILKPMCWIISFGHRQFSSTLSIVLKMFSSETKRSHISFPALCNRRNTLTDELCYNLPFNLTEFTEG